MNNYNYEELTKLNELVPHRGLLPTFNEIVNQLEKQKEVLDKIKKYIKERTEFGEYDHAYPGILNQDEVRQINRLLEEIE